MLTTLERRDPLHQEIAKLRRQRDEAWETVRLLSDMLAPPLAFPLDWRLTPTECRLLAALFKNEGGMTKEAMHFAIGADVEPDSKIKIVDVFVCKLRRKLGPRGVEIVTLWGRGYRLGQGREVIAAQLTAGETTKRELRKLCGTFAE